MPESNSPLSSGDIEGVAFSNVPDTSKAAFHKIGNVALLDKCLRVLEWHTDNPGKTANEGYEALGKEFSGFWKHHDQLEFMGAITRTLTKKDEHTKEFAYKIDVTGKMPVLDDVKQWRAHQKEQREKRKEIIRRAKDYPKLEEHIKGLEEALELSRRHASVEAQEKIKSQAQYIQQLEVLVFNLKLCVRWPKPKKTRKPKS